MKLINEMPETAQTEFRDRIDKLEEIDSALRDPGIRLIVLTGDRGIGKTALVGEVRRRLLNREFQAEMDGFIYLAASGYQHVSAGAVLDCLGRLAPSPEIGAALSKKLKSRLSWQAKLDKVLSAVSDVPAVLVIDDADALVADGGEVQDHQLDGLIKELIRRDDHHIRMLLVGGPTGASPWSNMGHEAAVQLCDVERGLPDREILPFLRMIDAADVLGLQEVPEADIRHLSAVSRGSPRFLELTYCLLRVDPEATVRSILDGIAPHDDVTVTQARNALVQRIIGLLKRTERRAVQALAVFGRPVPAKAVDFLLQDFVQAVDSASTLSRLAGWRLVRRDLDRYYLPPWSDVPDIRATVPEGRDTDWLQPEAPFTLPFLLQRAADYFEARRPQSDAAAGLDDLQPYFDEIDLRLTGKGYRRALGPMEEADDRFLARWGQSAAMNHWRREVRGKIGDDQKEAHNLSYLIAAREGEEDPHGLMAAALTEAMEQPWAQELPRERVRLKLQLARVYHDDGRLSRAAAEYRRAIRDCATHSALYEHASARTGLALCLARLGQFDEAERELTEAHHLGEALEGDERLEILATTLLNQGWLRGQVDEDGSEALSLLETGLKHARDLGDILLQGQLLDGQAALLCEQGQARRAAALAEHAAQMGLRTRNVTLSREANVTLALAYLYAGEDSAAANVSRAAVAAPAGIRALGAWVTHGVALFRIDETQAARMAFHQACTEAWLRLQREPGEFLAHDGAGLALCGLALCEHHKRLSDAVTAYQAARTLSSAPGSRRRCVSQLGLFGDRADEGVLAVARQAADGRIVSPPFRL